MRTHDSRTSTRFAARDEGAGLVDRSERGKLALTGAGAIEFLNGQVTNELVGAAAPATAATPRSSPQGQDARRRARARRRPRGPELATQLLLDTERVALQALFDMIREFKVGYDVELHKRTLERALLSLVGAARRRARRRRSAGGESTATRPAQIGGVAVLAIRTDAGDRPLSASAAERERAELGAARARRARRSARSAAEWLRIERGAPALRRSTSTRRTIPQEAG